MSEMKPRLLKIQSGDVYIQLPPDDSKAISLVKATLEFMEKWIESQLPTPEGVGL